MKNVILIPAYNPNKELVNTVDEIRKKIDWPVFVINDGSHQQADEFFEAISNDNVTILKHATNLGKGAALKTALNHIYVNNSDLRGVITADADGQHAVDDIINVGHHLKQSNDNLILGVRTFPKDIPFRSLFGNKLTITIFKLVSGVKISDTQTGLRGIPKDLIPLLLRLESNRYEYEIDMLLTCNEMGVGFTQVPIETIYIEDNQSSHFNPITDSMKIYFVLFRFSIISLLSALLDYIVFASVYLIRPNIAFAFVSARAVSALFNFTFNKKLVFKSNVDVKKAAFKYLLLLLFSGFISYSLIEILASRFNWPVLPAKVVVEIIVFLANFTIQRDFIFLKKR